MLASTQGSARIAGTVHLAAEGIPNGGSEQRTRYRESIATSGNQCVSETQTRTCSAGAWGSWSGTYAFDACRPAGSCVGSDGKAVANGGAEQRTRYRESTVTGGAPFNPSTS
jgi:hypothetical protein